MAQSNGYSRRAFAGRVIGGYRPVMPYPGHIAIREGNFNWRTDVPAMLRNSTIQIGLAVLKAPIFTAKWEVKANDREVQRFVDELYHHFWETQLSRVLDRYFAWGTATGENVYDVGARVNFQKIEEIWFFDTQAEHRGHEVVSLKVTNGVNHAGGVGYLTCPKMFFLAHDPPIGNPYGRSRLLGAWSAWMERDGSKGAKDARRLWFWKSARAGGKMYYPLGTHIGLDGVEKDNQDLAREIIEKSDNGAEYAIPNIIDENGNPLWKYEEAKIAGDGTSLIEYPKELDTEILKGMKVFPEVVQAAETGSGWSGRSVPLLTQLSLADEDVRNIIAAVDTCIVRPSVLANFGPRAKYKVVPVSLVPKDPPPGQGEGGQPPQGTEGQPKQPPRQPTGGEPQSIMGAQGPNPLQLSQADDEPASGDPHKALAEFYAALWNALYRTVDEIPDAELAAAVSKENESASAKASPQSHPGAAHGSSVQVKPTKQRAWSGAPAALKTTLTKQETGRVGEAVVLAYMRSVLKRKDAKPLNSSQTNFPIDLIEDHAPTEVKAGLASNSRKAEQWRLTFSKESAKEKEEYAKMTVEERAAWNADKQRRIKERKEKMLAAIQKKTGKKQKPRTITVILNPDTHTADIFEFDGWHDRIDWRSAQANAAYRGSVQYGHVGS